MQSQPFCFPLLWPLLNVQQLKSGQGSSVNSAFHCLSDIIVSLAGLLGLQTVHVSSSLPNSLSLQVKSDYDQLRKAFGCVSQERDLAWQEKAQLQDKLENLERVLKVRSLLHIDQGLIIDSSPTRIQLILQMLLNIFNIKNTTHLRRVQRLPWLALTKIL